MSIRTGSGTTTSFVTPGDVQLWGTPTALGTSSVFLRVTDADGVTAANTFPLKVVPLLQTTFLSSGTIGIAYSQTLRVLGGAGPYTAAVTAGQLPAGIALNPTTLLVSGTPAENGNLSWVTTFTDAGSVTLRVSINLFISGGASNSNINTNANLGFTTTGSSYSNSLNACCAGAFNWTLTSGTLPPGVTLSAGGLLSGTSTLSGTYTFLLKATDTGNATNTASRQFTLTVTPLVITSSSPLPSGNVGTAYTQTLTATGGTGTVTWTVAAGNYLPPGLGLATNGVLSGTPTETGQYRFTVTATDTASNIRSTNITVSINPGARWTDQPLVAGLTVIKAVHTTELRTAIDALRVTFSLAPISWTTLTGGTTIVQAQHIIDMRMALSQVYTAASVTPPTYTDSVLSAGTTMKAVHIEELRAAIIAIE
jgi:hypothetical protein